MKHLARLIEALAMAAGHREAQFAALRHAFREAAPPDAAWMLALLQGWRLPRLITLARLHEHLCATPEMPAWLFDASLAMTGDLAETLSLLLPTDPEAGIEAQPLHTWLTRTLPAWAALDEAARVPAVMAALRGLTPPSRLALLRLLGGGLSSLPAAELLADALAAQHGLAAHVMAQRLAVYAQAAPTPERYAALTQTADRHEAAARPAWLAPFAPQADAPEVLASPGAWLIETAWLGQRAQIMHVAGHLAIWDDAQGLIGARYPELMRLAQALPEGTVLDGLIVVWPADASHPREAGLAARQGRQRLTARLRQDAPVVCWPLDVLCCAGEDLRGLTLRARRARLQALLAALPDDAARLVRLPPVCTPADADALQAVRHEARTLGAQGVWCRRWDDPYPCPSVQADRAGWRLWRHDPRHIQAVVLYAQRGGDGLLSHYTLAVRDEASAGDALPLVPVAKVEGGLTPAEAVEVDALLRASVTEKFGPVRAVTPQVVLSLAFDAVQASSRHKCGLVLRHPRVIGWAREASLGEVASLSDLRRLSPAEPARKAPVPSGSTGSPGAPRARPV